MVLISTTGKADVSAALERPGVIAAFTGRDLAPDYGSLPTAWIVSDDLIVPDHPPIAADEARYVGDAVAVVVAEDPYQAADAVEAVQVEYEPLPAVVDPVAALADGAPLVHGGESLDLVSTVAMPVLKRFGPVLGGVAFGLILGLLLGHRRRIVIMTAAVPPGGYPPAPTVL